MWIGLGFRHRLVWIVDTLLPPPLPPPPLLDWFAQIRTHLAKKSVQMPHTQFFWNFWHFFIQISQALKRRPCRPFLLSHSLSKLTYLPPRTPRYLKIQMYNACFLLAIYKLAKCSPGLNQFLRVKFQCIGWKVWKFRITIDYNQDLTGT